MVSASTRLSTTTSMSLRFSLRVEGVLEDELLEGGRVDGLRLDEVVDDDLHELEVFAEGLVAGVVGLLDELLGLDVDEALRLGARGLGRAHLLLLARLPGDGGAEDVGAALADVAGVGAEAPLGDH